MSIPDGWTEVTNGEWGLGTEPFPQNTPLGVHYVDKFGNRCVVTPDGQYKVEGIGVGANAGKPDGQWWDWTPELGAGPTSSEPWVGDQTAGSAPVEENPAAVAPPVAPLATPQALAPVDTNADPMPDQKPPMQAPPLSAPSAHPQVVGKPKVTIVPTHEGFLVRLEHETGQVFEHPETDVQGIAQHVEAWVKEHI